MADKAISELVAAPSVTPDSLFVLQQDNTAKKLTAQVLENWLLSFADGHGGIHSYELLKTVGLVKTYRFTLADQTYMDIDVVDGRGVTSLKPTSTNGLEVTYTITYNDGTTDTFTVTNGAKGDKGDNANIWVKYASQKPTAESHSFGDVPDAWIGISSGHLAGAPTEWQQYTWYQWKGEKGDTGEPATLVSSEITYQVGDSGTIIPSGNWNSGVPPVAPGRYLWIRQVLQFNTGAPITSYSVSRFGIDGSGAVSTVAGVAPDENGNVPLDAASVKALPVAGGTMSGPINMNGQQLSGLNAPTENSGAVPKGYLDSAIKDFTTKTDVIDAVKNAAPRNLLDNSDFTNPVNQRGKDVYEGDGYTIDRWVLYEQNASVAIEDNCISVVNELFQVIADEAINIAKTYTLAVCNSNGDIRIVSGIPNIGFSDDYLSCYVEPDDNRVRCALIGDQRYKWAALYEGEYTIDTLPEYQPKGYGAELSECLRYAQIIKDGAFASNTGAGSDRVVGITIPGTTLRVKPSIVVPVYDSAYVSIVSSKADGYAVPTSITVQEQSTGCTKLLANVPQSVGFSAVCVTSFSNILLSADL